MAGNQHVEKWSEEKAMKFFTDSLELAKENTDIYFIGKLASELGWYREAYHYLLKKFKNNSAFHTIKKQIDAILEARVIEKGYDSGGATMSIFQLKNNYHWKDKKEDGVNIELKLYEDSYKSARDFIKEKNESDNSD